MSATSTVGSLGKYPKAIVHVDGDAFFASCEVARNPALKGKPVVVGGLRGIALALTYEAKARGIVRGMPTKQVAQFCPEAIILPGDYDLYTAHARRMYRIVGRYSECVQEYSVDECFADITNEENPEAVAQAIKNALEADLGITFSVGLATTKVLAKVASKHSKPSGFVCIPQGTEDQFLQNLSVGKVWGIGPATAGKLVRQGVRTALEFKNLLAWRVQEGYAKPHYVLWQELNGQSILHVHSDVHDEQQSIAATRTFRPPTKDKARVYAEFAKNVERACEHAREKKLASRHLYCFLKSQDFQYRRFEVTLTARTNLPSIVLNAVRSEFEKQFRYGVTYRATGITLSDLAPQDSEQRDLFGAYQASDKTTSVWRTVDALKGEVFLAASLGARKRSILIPTLGLPYMGEAH